MVPNYKFECNKLPKSDFLTNQVYSQSWECLGSCLAVEHSMIKSTPSLPLPSLLPSVHPLLPPHFSPFQIPSLLLPHPSLLLPLPLPLPLPPLPFLFSLLLLTNGMSDFEGCLVSKSARSRNAWAKRGL